MPTILVWIIVVALVLDVIYFSLRHIAKYAEPTKRHEESNDNQQILPKDKIRDAGGHWNLVNRKQSDDLERCSHGSTNTSQHPVIFPNRFHLLGPIAQRLLGQKPAPFYQGERGRSTKCKENLSTITIGGAGTLS